MVRLLDNAKKFYCLREDICLLSPLLGNFFKYVCPPNASTLLQLLGQLFILTLKFPRMRLAAALVLFIDLSICLISVIALAMGTDLQQLSFLGIMGLLDPPRPGVREAVHTLLESGVQVKMLTGDARETALTIGNFMYSNLQLRLHLALWLVQKVRATSLTNQVQMQLKLVTCIFPLLAHCVFFSSHWLLVIISFALPLY